MPKSYTPNWFFTALLDNHINQMMARYSCLRALRMDFFYRKDTPDFLQPDHRWLELQLRMLLEQVEQFENIVVRINPDGSVIYLRDVARIEASSG